MEAECGKILLGYSHWQMEIVRDACLVFDTYVKEVNAAGKFRNLDSLECKVNRAVPSRENLGHAFLFALQK